MRSKILLPAFLLFFLSCSILSCTKECPSPEKNSTNSTNSSAKTSGETADDPYSSPHGEDNGCGN